MPDRKIPCLHHGKTVTQMMVKGELTSPNPSGINYDTVVHSTQEGAHNWSLQKFRNFFQGLQVRRLELPNDTKDSQGYRQGEWNRQASMPWGNHFMVTQTDGQRLNNPSQQAFVSQKQLAPPNSYQQFYAFMHALSAAFGTMKSQ